MSGGAGMAVWQARAPSSATVLALLLLLTTANSQQEFTCRLSLRGYGPQTHGVAAASLHCNSSSSSSSSSSSNSSSSLLPVHIDFRELSQLSQTFVGVVNASSNLCLQHAGPAAAPPAAAAAAAAAETSAKHSLLYFCHGNITFEQPVVEGVWLNDTAAAKQPSAVLGFGGNAKVTIVGGRFSNNHAGSQLLVTQQAVVTVLSGALLNNNTAETGAAAYVSDAAALNISGSSFSELRAQHSAGAVYSDGNATVHIAGSRFRNCTAGKAGGCIVALGRTKLTVHDSSMAQSSAAQAGGALYVTDSAVARITSSRFSENSGGSGGALAAGNSSVVVISSSRFEGNQAVGLGDGAADAAAGGAIAVRDNARRMCVCVCHTLAHVDAANGSYFSGNQATHGGAISADGQAEVNLTRSMITQNQAHTGGAMFLTGNSSSTLSSSNLTANRAAAAGGAAAVQVAAVLQLVSSTAQGNNAAGEAGAILCGRRDSGQVVLQNAYVVANTARGAGGGAVAAGNCSFVVNASYVASNTAFMSGGGLSVVENAQLGITNGSFIRYNSARLLGGGVHFESWMFQPVEVTAAVQNNTARYNQDVSVSATTIAVVGNATVPDFVSRLGFDSQNFKVIELAVTGHRAFPVEGALVQCTLYHEPFPPTHIGVERSGRNGSAVFSLGVRKPPGQYTISCGIIDASGGGGGSSLSSEIAAANISLKVRPCIRGEVTPSFDSCQECPAGYYSFDPSEVVCRLCPSEVATCPGGGLMVPEPGYWRSSANSTQVHRCPNPSACVPSNTSALIACQANPECREQVNFSHSQCSDGYKGNLCGVCVDGYGTSSPFTCRKCMHSSVVIAFYAVSAVVMLCIMKWLVEATFAANQLFTEADDALILPADLLKPLLLYSQYIMVLGSIQIDFPAFLMEPVRALAWFWAPANPETLSIDCLLSPGLVPLAIQRTLFYLSMPFVMLVALLVVEAMWLHILHKLGRAARSSLADRLLLSAFVVAFFFLPTISRNIFNFFACVPVDKPAGGPPYTATAVGSYWSMDLNAQCWTGYHLYWTLGLAVPLLILVCIGLPAAIVYITLSNRHQLNDAKFSEHFGFLYRTYKPRYCWWEAVVMLQTISLVAISVHCHSLGPLYQGLFVNATLAFVLVLLMACKPYVHSAACAVSLRAVGCLVLTSYAAISFLPYGVYRSTAAYGIAMGVVLLCVNVAFVGSVLWQLYKIIQWRQIIAAVQGLWNLVRSRVVGSCFGGRARTASDSMRSVGSYYSARASGDLTAAATAAAIGAATGGKDAAA